MGARSARWHIAMAMARQAKEQRSMAWGSAMAKRMMPAAYGPVALAAAALSLAAGMLEAAAYMAALAAITLAAFAVAAPIWFARKLTVALAMKGIRWRLLDQAMMRVGDASQVEDAMEGAMQGFHDQWRRVALMQPMASMMAFRDALCLAAALNPACAKGWMCSAAGLNPWVSAMAMNSMLGQLNFYGGADGLPPMRAPMMRDAELSRWARKPVGILGWAVSSWRPWSRPIGHIEKMAASGDWGSGEPAEASEWLAWELSQRESEVLALSAGNGKANAPSSAGSRRI